MAQLKHEVIRESFKIAFNLSIDLYQKCLETDTIGVPPVVEERTPTQAAAGAAALVAT